MRPLRVTRHNRTVALWYAAGEGWLPLALFKVSGGQTYFAQKPMKTANAIACISSVKLMFMTASFLAGPAGRGYFRPAGISGLPKANSIARPTPMM